MGRPDSIANILSPRSCLSTPLPEIASSVYCEWALTDWINDSVFSWACMHEKIKVFHSKLACTVYFYNELFFAIFSNFSTTKFFISIAMWCSLQLAICKNKPVYSIITLYHSIYLSFFLLTDDEGSVMVLMNL